MTIARRIQAVSVSIISVDAFSTNSRSSSFMRNVIDFRTDSSGNSGRPRLWPFLSSFFDVRGDFTADPFVAGFGFVSFFSFPIWYLPSPLIFVVAICAVVSVYLRDGILRIRKTIG